MAGIKNPSVFPVPVFALTRTSLPSKLGGIASSWHFVILSYPKRWDTVFLSSSTTFRLLKLLSPNASLVVEDVLECGLLLSPSESAFEVELSFSCELRGFFFVDFT